MRITFAIAKRELNAYFLSPIAYIVAAVILAILGYMFYLVLFWTKQASLRPLFEQITPILIIIMPLLTMRLLAEERRSGTIELLLTSPIRDSEVILGKFLAGFGLFALMLAPTAYYVLVLAVFGKPDWGPILTVYVGTLLFGGALLSIGILASSVTSNQIVGALVGMGIIALLWLLPSAGTFVSEPIRGILTYMGLSSHIAGFAKGIIDTADIVFYVSIIVGALFLATRVLEARKWR